MHVTLHLTDACNLSCRYCYVRQDEHYMSPEIARAAIDFASRDGGECGVALFGGEPLLCRDIIYDVVSYAKQIEKQGRSRFHFKMTTNGTLLDDEFLKYAVQNEIFIALSFDGTPQAHDRNRITKSGLGSSEKILSVMDKLLDIRPYSPVMMTVSPNTVSEYAKGVKYLYNKGFRYLICTLDYSADWNESSLKELKKQYKLLAEFYEDLTLREEKFYLSPFEVKIASHVRGDYCAERCELGKKQVSVAPDGSLYPCVQFVGESKYNIGNVWQGVDRERQLKLFKDNDREKQSCEDCAIRNRCNHHCGCLNKQATGSINTVSPVLCAHERILLPIADKLAERLYKNRNAMFIQKQYNDMFPLLSLTEDRTVIK